MANQQDKDFEYFHYNFAVVFWWIERNLLKIWKFLADTARNVQGVWLIGDFLYDLLWDASVRVLRMYDAFYWLEHNLPSFVNLVRDIYEEVGEVLSTITDIGGLFDFLTQPVTWFITYIVSYWPSLGELLDNPLLWFQDRVLEFSGDLWEFATDAYTFLWNYITDEFPFLEKISLDPVGFVTDQIRLLNELAVELLSDPTKFIEESIKYSFPDLSDLLIDPVFWLTDTIRTLSADLAQIVENGREWLWTTFTDILDKELEEKQEWLTNTADRLLRLIW